MDANVLISAFRGSGQTATDALAILADASREFVASDFLRLELIPKATFNKRPLEIQFYERFFRAADMTITSSDALVSAAEAEAIVAVLDPIPFN